MRKLFSIFFLCALHAGAQTNQFGYPVAPDASSADTGIPVTPSVTFDVTATGGASFSYPIEVPKGLPGIEPSIAVTYNSQAGNGIAGYGCNLSGISVISVVPKDRFHDGTAIGCKWDGTDALALDGARLILKSGTYGSSGSVYCTENNPFVRITMYKNFSGIYQNTWFEIQDQNGITYTYGQTGDSRQDFIGHDGLTKTNAWYVNRVENTVGNYMTYEYTVDSLYVYPSIIEYGMNTADASLVNRIRFQYNDRYYDYSHFVIDGAKGAMRKILSHIYTETGNYTYKWYSLSYSSDNEYASALYHRLTSISVNGSGDNSQKPTEFTWNLVPQDQNIMETLGLNLPSEAHILHFMSDPHFFTGDINGDGVSDIIEHINVNVGTTPHNYFYLYKSSVGSQGIQYNSPLLIDLPGDFTVDWETDKSLSPMTIDYDGDGLSDIIIPRISNSQVNYFYYYILYGKDLSNGDVTSVMHVIHTLSSASVIPLYNSADFNKDGIFDIIVFEPSQVNNHYTCCLFEGAENHNELIYSTYSLSLPSTPKQLFVSDYNGDGMTDLLVTYEGGYKIFWNRGGSSNTLFSSSDSTAGTTVSNGFRVVDGDFNGDGLTDFMVNSNGGTYWNEYRNQGDGSFSLHSTHTIPVYLTCNSDNDKKNFRVIVADLNSDGKSDVFVSKALYGNNGHYIKTYSYWLMSKSGDLLVQKYNATSVKESDASPGYYTVGDFHGLGRMELMNYGYNCLSANDANVSPQIHVYPVSGRDAGNGHIASIKDALQRTSSLSYKSMTNPSVYTKGVSDYPVISCTVPLSAVSSVTSSQGAAGQHTTQYTYQDLKIHTAGRGMMGMSKVVSTNAQQGITTEQVVENYDQNIFVPVATHTKTTTSDNKYTIQSNSTTLSANGGAYCVSSTSQTMTDFDGLVTQKIVTYDTSTHGKVLSESTTSEQHSKGASYQYTLAGSVYQPNAVAYTQQHADDASPYSYTDTYAYNSLGLMTSKTSFSNKSRPQTATYTYDIYGNVTSKSLAGTSGLSLPTEYYAYDATHRFMTECHSSSLLPSRVYGYDMWGRMTSEGIVRGNITNYTTHTYNAVGLRASTTRPDGTMTTYTYGWGSTPQQRYYILRQGTAEPWVKTWYDNCGREVLTETVGPMGMTVTTTKTYDAKGRVSTITVDEGSRHQLQSMTYDNQGRILSNVLSTGQSTSYSYEKLKVTSTENGLTTTKTYDPWRNLKSSQQGTVTVTYSYNSQGNPVSVSSSADNQTAMEMEYDDMGCRTELTDADAGTISYEYDGLNRMVSQTDARGKEIVTIYNSLGQKTSEIADTITTTYNYYTSGSGIGQLSSATTNNNTLSYSYDNKGRVSSESRTLSSNNTYTYTYQYNQQGLLSSKTYPLNVTEQFEYDAYGYMSRQKVAGQTVWERTSATGIVDQYALGGGLLTRHNSYDNAGRLTETRTGLSSNSTPLFQMSFSYNALGSLTQRTLLGQGTETFTYDSYDRLLSASTAGMTQSVTYAQNGNILSKTNLGQYHYDISKPHAVSGVDNTDGVISMIRLNLKFNPYSDVQSIHENYVRRGRFTYGPDGERWQAVIIGRHTDHLGDVEHIQSSPLYTETWFYYLANDVLYVKKAGVSDSVYYICRDNLGSIMRIMDVAGREVFDATYDAWGFQNVNRNDINFFRGYTGHEMISQYDLIHMNGRIFDPLLGRFVSPDNYVQMPENPQNLNRYSYCLNNPLKYTDPNGEFFIGTIINGVKDFIVNTFVNVWEQGINAWTNKDNWHSTYMSWKIDMGLFKGSFKQVLSRFTWEAPQTFLGYTLATLQNTFNGVKSVSYYGGATAVETYSERWGGFTLGSFIMGSRGLQADPNNTLFQHEYGHYLQSQSYGLYYLQRCAIPSFFDTLGREDHNNHPVEQDANIRAFRYFSENIKGYGIKKTPYGKGWNMKTNNILGYKVGLDYYNPINQAALHKTLNLGWPDYLFGASVIVPGILDNILLHQ